MEKIKRFLAGIGSIVVVSIGCYFFSKGFNYLFSSNFLVNMCGAACLMTGVYEFFTGLTLLAGVIAGKKVSPFLFVVSDASEKKEETDNEL